MIIQHTAQALLASPERKALISRSRAATAQLVRAALTHVGIEPIDVIDALPLLPERI